MAKIQRYVFSLVKTASRSTTLALSLVKLIQALSAYREASVATIRKMIGCETEEDSANLLSVVDKAAFARTVEGLKLTADDRRRYRQILEEAETEVAGWA